MKRKSKKKKDTKKVSSARGNRRAEKVQSTGNILRVIGMLLMIAFYVIMIYTIFSYRSQIDEIINQFNNSTGTVLLPIIKI